MKRLFLTPIIFISLFSLGQSQKNISRKFTSKGDSITFSQKCKDFIKQVRQYELFDTSFFLSDNPFPDEYDRCFEDVLEDTGFYTKEEKAFIKNKKHPSFSKWTESMFENENLISGDTIDAYFKIHSISNDRFKAWENRSKAWANFHESVGKGYKTYSIPIFLRNDTYCLFYSGYWCGQSCGLRQIILYKNENGKWKKFKTYNPWVSFDIPPQRKKNK